MTLRCPHPVALGLLVCALLAGCRGSGESPGAITLAPADAAALQAQRGAIVAHLTAAGATVEPGTHGVISRDPKALRAAAAAVLGPGRFALGQDDKDGLWYLYALAGERRTLRATSIKIQGSTGKPTLFLRLDEPGRAALAALTKAHVGKRLLLMAGDEVLSAPRVKETVSGGMLSVEVRRGGLEEAKRILGRLTTP